MGGCTGMDCFCKKLVGILYFLRVCYISKFCEGSYSDALFVLLLMYSRPLIVFIFDGEPPGIQPYIDLS